MAEKELKPMVRLLNSDIEGNTSVYLSLQKIKGVGFSMANAVCNVLKIDKNEKVGYLEDKDLEKIEDVLKNPKNYNIKNWLLNRRKDYDTGEDKHVVEVDLKLAKDDDLKRLKMIKSYRGMRHQAGLPVRGQRTKAHFRKGTALGVKRKK
ncbi:30S ribosomal protein S13 [Candidatus Woesearchaeota archaeon]|nr:MAG: 30S ribosomal protein S13 [Candidatus Woesearchaeota archaeon]